jgi:hypothetical protein
MTVIMEMLEKAKKGILMKFSLGTTAPVDLGLPP